MFVGATGLAQTAAAADVSWRECEGDRDADRVPSNTAAPLRATVLGDGSEGSEETEDRCVVVMVGEEMMGLAMERPSRTSPEEEEEGGSSADFVLRGGDENDAEDNEEEEEDEERVGWCALSPQRRTWALPSGMITLARLRYQALPSFTGVPASRLGSAPAKERRSGDWCRTPVVVDERVTALGGVWNGEMPGDEVEKAGGVLSGPDKGPTGPSVCVVSVEEEARLWPDEDGVTCVPLLVCIMSIGWTWSAPWITIGGLCPPIADMLDKVTCLSGDAC